jgi:hypothetical protein
MTRLWGLLFVLLCAALCAGCFGSACTVQRVRYTDAEGATTWLVTSCHPRLTLRWK